MKILIPDPAALVTAHYIQTAAGPLIKVRLITPDRIDWRSYHPIHSPDEAVRLAMQSAGVDRAWTQLALPIPGEHASHGEDRDCDTQQSRDRRDGHKGP